MNWLLAFVPIAIALEQLAPERHLWIWLKGVQLLAIYAILGLACFFAPAALPSGPRPSEGAAGW